MTGTHAADGGSAPVRVVVAEDAYVIREFLTATLSAAPEIELVAVCSNGKELETAIANRVKATLIHLAEENAD